MPDRKNRRDPVRPIDRARLQRFYTDLFAWNISSEGAFTAPVGLVEIEDGKPKIP